jgi:hypothetical protein
MYRITSLVLVAMLGLITTPGGTKLTEHAFCAGGLHAQVMAAQKGEDPVMPPAGNPDHVQPAKGAFCDHSDRPAHACKCHPTCVIGADGKMQVQEDLSHCRGNCYKDHCHCPSDCP